MKYLYLCVLSFLILSNFSSCSPVQDASANTEDSNKLEDSLKVIANFERIEDFTEKPKINNLTFAVTGDLMCHGSQYKTVFEGNDTYNFLPVFEAVKPFLSAADVAIGNLETVLAGEGKNYKSYPQFNTPNAYADALKDAGFDIIVTVNNHTYDQGKAGVLRTLDELDKRNFTGVLGSYRTQEAQDEIKVFEKNDIKYSVLAYTQFSNITLRSSESHLFQLIDTVKVGQDIQKARKQGAEIVLIHYHWGAEYLPEPNSYQKMITEKTIQLGADVIIGGHPHVVQPLKKYKTQNNATLDSGIVAYSMGNFYSGQRKRYRHNGLILWLEMEKITEKNDKNEKVSKISLKNIAHLPTWVYYGKAGNPSKNEYRIYPAQNDSIPFSPFLSLDTLDFISKSGRAYLNQSRKDTDNALKMYNVDSKYLFLDKDGKAILK
ncbi:Bacterial capsule synthesis protein PGA_cap [Bernardetia litoralis DSM 6794]|uniref:Bacterial capsule synthesis protein PGA_cap n=1 Tax=Bernardetia litoralis (strain ATCC 23117 / DSM 6794 / NBRC 15988 / NCIMB 1366 / Fx l1 / Sio-4) TaxID=880071 RepID=I4AIF9_BERLS|nr:CapA family protein [Bernardetia litoralis]AFM03744.1 Bacterial capsule synthesis protein PGA_cap [Bernardetia litoralis DSM 6794]